MIQATPAGSATSPWETIDPLKWRIYLGKSVTFHNGEDFTADDVLFSLQRVRTPGSQLRTVVPADVRAVKVDDYTVDFLLTSPNPILNAEWSAWYILSKKWAEANGATQAQMASAASLSAIALKTNGRGPFIVESHEPGVKTVFKSNPKWWGKKEYNFDEVVFLGWSLATKVAFGRLSDPAGRNASEA